MTTPLTPQQVAIALTYGKNQGAPKVVAKGRGLIAQAIIERARQHGIFVHENSIRKYPRNFIWPWLSCSPGYTALNTRTPPLFPRLQITSFDIMPDNRINAVSRLWKKIFR
jgi:hypothetical protein